MPASAFHPAVRAWFEDEFQAATAVQAEAWPAIASGSHTLLAAPTGSGKTLAAFLSAIDALVREGLRDGLPDATRVLYVSPLKALSNDVQHNLQAPIEGIRARLRASGLSDVEIRAWVRTGDTPPAEREKARRQPPHILVTTPESAYILLTSESGRAMLGSVETVIVDEIHSLAGSKRGAHLALSLERLEDLVTGRLRRIGLSATQKPIADMARFLVGARDAPCTIVDTGHVRARDLALEVPDSPLEAVMANEVWQEIYTRLEKLVREHRTTLVFVNTRRLAERAARFLAERIGEDNVTSHHGSLAKEHRLEAEQRLKAGALKCLVATSSLELGIDIGDIDLVCQLGSPRSIAAFLQRVGRSGHSVGATPKGRLFPLSRDELVECVALLEAARRGELDRIRIPAAPLDVLSQQIVAEVAAGERDTRALLASFRRAWPYRDLSQDAFDDVVRMLAEGFSTRRGRRSAHLHHDAVNGRLRARRGARLTAITNGGVIPDQFDYDVILSPEGLRIGSLNEDFAFESLPGDIFQLGNTSYRILKIELGKVHVADAKGQPPNIPFWFGEAPGRSDELSLAVSRLRAEVDARLEEASTPAAEWLAETHAIPAAAAAQLTDYLAAARAALGCVPTQHHVVLERFFDETGDMHLVIHAPFGSRINRAWGLALRKRFCRKFNFELQAAALEDSIILSLSATHSFPLEEVAAYLASGSVREVLVQALLAAPMFPTRWRWNATNALAVRRMRNGKRAPPYFQRADAEDLVAVIFPDQLACQENLAGHREIPDHPLVAQTIADCLHEFMDVDGLVELLRRRESAELVISARDLAAPSPLAQEILNARPYAFLDDAPAEERRALAVQSRGFTQPAEAGELARLDAAAIERVCREAWPEAHSADELHDALVVLGFLSDAEIEHGDGWRGLLGDLVRDARATALATPAGHTLWVAAERLPELERLFPGAATEPVIVAPAIARTAANAEDALREVLRSRLEGLGPVSAASLAEPLAVAPTDVVVALTALEQEGFVVRGRFRNPSADVEEWCERRLLARIHRYTVKRLRSEVEPVSVADFMRFLLDWQGLSERGEGREATTAALEQLEGYAMAAAAWENDVLPARIDSYTGDQLDGLCASGRFTWMRLAVAQAQAQKRGAPVRHTPIALVERRNISHWRRLAPLPDASRIRPSATAERVRDWMRGHGACFFVDLVEGTGMLRTQVEAALGELVSWGVVTSDSFTGLRALITPESRRPRFAPRRGRYASVSPFDAAGRWSLIAETPAGAPGVEDFEFLAKVLLRRYGVVFRRLLERESVVVPWRELLRVYWRMEARGEIRGGRFVDGVAGEQFALPDAVGALRKVRRSERDDAFVVVAAVDPLNLAGTLLPGERITATLGNRMVLRNGLPVAVQSADALRFLVE
ncbi:MAG: DEAD/DEAH box helicase, partial [Gammaproteobacteria bacterium]|nr:DEAD/DEAH box helicase [Gammaproteobacteria bacterium]